MFEGYGSGKVFLSVLFVPDDPKAPFADTALK